MANERDIPGNYTRMIIMEAVSEEQARDVRNLLDAHVADCEPCVDGFVTSQRLSEDGGNMVVLEMTFSARQTALAYGASRRYRSLVQSVQHLLVGAPVVKLFRQYSHTGIFALPIA